MGECAADAAHHMRHTVRRPLVIPPIYIASGRRGLRPLYPILGVYRLKTARIYPRKSYRRHIPAGAPEIQRAMGYSGGLGPRRPNTTLLGRGAAKQWRREASILANSAATSCYAQ